MAEYSWPSREDATVIGKSHIRLDGETKAVGTAKYTYDVNLPKMLVARALGSPHGHCKIVSIDTVAARKTPGVVDIRVLRKVGDELNWSGELIAIVAAETEGAAAEGVKNIKLKLEELDVFTDDEDLKGAEKAGRTVKGGGKAITQNEPNDDEDEDEFIDAEIERLLKASKHTVEGYYGIDTITHCCLEPHGATLEWKGEKLDVHLSTQNVSGTDDGLAKSLDIKTDDVDVQCHYIGGGFGSKFAADYWTVAAAEIAKKTGRPVKLMLSRDQELKIAGSRPSGYINVRLGANEQGVVQVWDSNHWGSAGWSTRGGGVSHSVVPYVLVPENFRRLQTNIKTNTSRARAWRAPNHPQACAMTQTALDDLAAVMGADSYDIFMRNLKNANNEKADVYAAEMKIGAGLIDWKTKWHAHGKGKANGSIVTGLGMALHTWGGTANSSNCLLKIYPDGGVETFCGTQDLGTGTRTVCAMVLAETFGLTIKQMKINIGSSKYPASGASGGSTTVGSVCESHRRAGQDATEKIFALVAGKLGVDAGTLEARDGRIHVKGDKSKGLSWKESCSLLGLKPLEVNSSYTRGTKSPLSSERVGGVQMAEVAVDKETGVIKIRKFVAVQDMGLVVNPQAAESQITGAITMGIASALYEQRICDPKTGDFVNAELSDYKLPRLADVGDLVVLMYEPESERQRGVIGLGEPPVVSPGAAISNAVCNALGVRVPVLPMTPQRVLAAIKKHSKA